MRDIPIILFGVGGVGRSLVRQILDLREMHAAVYGLTLSFAAVCDRNGAVLPMEGTLGDDVLQEILALKENGGQLANHTLGGPQGDSYSIVDLAGRSRTVVVDCTASDATVPALLFALERDYGVVLANKKPLTGEQEVYDLLASGREATSSRSPVRSLHKVRWETTVGAGLPINAMLSRLMSSGDTVQRITGAFSGTLDYLMSELQDGVPFSQIVRTAYQQGYTEPDPRDDLSGMDVARKALILGRGLGWKLDLADVEVEGLYPPKLDTLSVEEFLDALPDLDDEYSRRVEEAHSQGQVLRYAAIVQNRACSAGPVMAPQESPLGRLTGTDNLVEFTTRWYHPSPLVIQGKGACVDVTAAGVLSDIIELAAQ